jgi:aspartate racemase
MRTIGMIGGMSWESSIEYYRILNETIKNALGGLHSAQCLLYSLDFEEIERLQHSGNWAELTKILVAAAKKLKLAGAESFIICTNTMHKTAEQIEKESGLKLLHIADAAGQAVCQRRLKKIALLGTKFTMEEDFYRKRLEDIYGLEVMVPPLKERDEIHRIIYEELCQGDFKDASRTTFVSIIEELAAKGAEGIVLGCTEIPLLVREKDSVLPIFDTMKIHARAAADWMLEQADVK